MGWFPQDWTVPVKPVLDGPGWLIRCYSESDLSMSVRFMLKTQACTQFAKWEMWPLSLSTKSRDTESWRTCGITACVNKYVWKWGTVTPMGGLRYRKQVCFLELKEGCLWSGFFRRSLQWVQDDVLRRRKLSQQLAHPRTWTPWWCTRPMCAKWISKNFLFATSLSPLEESSILPSIHVCILLCVRSIKK